MISFIQNNPGVETLFQQFVTTSKNEPINGLLEIPASLGSGFLKLEKLPNGLDVLIMNYCLNDDLFYERPPGSKEFYTLRSREINVTKSVITTIDNEELKEPVGIHKSLFLTSSLFDISFFISKNTPVAAINIELNREWMAGYLHMDVYDDILLEYLSLKIKMLDAVIMDADYADAHAEILNIDKDHPAEATILHNRIMYIIERFFTELYEQRKQIKYQLRNNSEDIDAIIAVETKLAAGIKEGFPSVNQLAKEAGMSASKLKTLFKKIYGKALFEYFQERRMLKAKAMLLSNHYAVKETAFELGFRNISNFTLAFKKQFGILPNEFTKRGK
jgi:AraC-like DNA-binding protein